MLYNDVNTSKAQFEVLLLKGIAIAGRLKGNAKSQKTRRKCIILYIKTGLMTFGSFLEFRSLLL